jgi:hypothetical protein
MTEVCELMNDELNEVNGGLGFIAEVGAIVLGVMIADSITNNKIGWSSDSEIGRKVNALANSIPK